MKKTNKITKIIFILFIIGLIIVNSFVSLGGISLPNMDPYHPSDPTIFKIGGQVIYVVQIIFYAAAVIILMFAGIKYMSSAPEGKAEMKKKLAYMVTGAIMLFAAGGIVQIIGNLALNNI